MYDIIEYSTHRVGFFCLTNKSDVFQSMEIFLTEEFVRLRASNSELGTATFTMDEGWSDNGKMIKLMLSYNIAQQYILYYTPEHNAIIARVWRTLLEMATAMLMSSDPPDSYWEYAILCTAYINNRIPLVRQPVGLDKLLRSPEEAFYGLGAPS